MPRDARALRSFSVLSVVLFAQLSLEQSIISLNKGLIGGACSNVDSFHGNVVFGYEDLGGASVLGGLSTYSFSYWMKPTSQILTFSLTTWPLYVQSNMLAGTKTQTILANQFCGVSAKFVQVSVVKDYFVLGQECRFGPSVVTTQNSLMLDTWGFYSVSVQPYSVSITFQQYNGIYSQSATQSYATASQNGISCATSDFWSLNYTSLAVYVGSRYNQKLCGLLADLKFLPGIYFAQLPSEFQQSIMYGNRATMRAYYRLLEPEPSSAVLDYAQGRNIALDAAPNNATAAVRAPGYGYVFGAQQYLQLPSFTFFDADAQGTLGYWVLISHQTTTLQVFRKLDRTGAVRHSVAHGLNVTSYNTQICGTLGVCVTVPTTVPADVWTRVLIGFYYYKGQATQLAWVYTDRDYFLFGVILGQLIAESQDDQQFLGSPTNNFSAGGQFTLKDFFLAQGSG